ncbi:hypothetical protein [Blastopirellula marina]|uniref:Uncharacterized protein n=1 Tax=Blastopirellula marina TaxID=124 RepID=A0A2S8GNR2_9BACT|nr:hypothetical protein [Blastopirellula marina]PQO46052.1 hypothetical protein C5Y93_10765 [Blastopirellula marina]
MPLRIQAPMTGYYHDPVRFNLEELGFGRIPMDMLVLVWWERKIPFCELTIGPVLDKKAKASQTQSSADGAIQQQEIPKAHQEFTGRFMTAGDDKLQLAMREYSFDSPEEIEAYVPDFLSSNYVRFGVLKDVQLLEGKLSLDSNSVYFRQEVQNQSYENDFSFHLRIYRPKPKALQAQTEDVKEKMDEIFGDKHYWERTCEIHISLDPPAQSSSSDICVAIDFGNTNSSVALVDLADTNPPDPHKAIVQLENQSARDSVPTEVRFSRLTWHIGKRARAFADRGDDSSGDLVLGAKRLLVDRARPNLSLLASGVNISSTAPAKIFMRQLIGELRQATRAPLDSFVCTYPTTYTRKEIEQTRMALAEAISWADQCREIPADMLLCVPAQGAEKPLKRLIQQGCGEIPYMQRKLSSDRTFLQTLRAHVDRQTRSKAPTSVPLMLDEASAAAFYFLYRNFIRQPGRTAGTRWVYNNGLNLLLFDCGGGTTDIALVRAHMRLSESDHTWTIDLDVLGRTGHRSFGGDDITFATARLLKGEIAARIKALPEKSVKNAKTDPNYQFMIDMEKLDASLGPLGDLDEVIPSTFDPWKPPEHTRRDKERFADHLWRLAEDVKLAVCGSSSSPPSVPKNSPINLFISANCPAVQSEEAAEAIVTEVVRLASRDPDQFRERIDTLIAKDVDKCVELAHKLVSQRLHKPDARFEVPRESFVHFAFILGKASSYPSIRQQLIEGLGVEEDRIKFASDEAKAAVAIGAALARRKNTGIDTVKVNWDRDLENRLAHKVLIDSDRLSSQEVWDEFLPYEELEEKSYRIPQDKGKNEDDDEITEGATKLNLYRRWPGDDENHLEHFQTFKFDDPPEEITLFWDDEEQVFGAYDTKLGKDEGRALVVPVSEKIFIPHVRRGEI